MISKVLWEIGGLQLFDYAVQSAEKRCRLQEILEVESPGMVAAPGIMVFE